MQTKSPNAAVNARKALPADLCTVKSVRDGVLEFVISHESPDLVGDVVVQSGLKAISPRIPAQVDHSGRMADVIGYWGNLKTIGDYTTAELTLVDRGISKMADLVRGLSEAGVRLAASIGFTSTKVEPLKPRGFKFLESALHEISVVVVPCQPLAIQLAKSFGVDLSADSSISAPDNARQQAGSEPLGVSAVNPTKNSEGKTMSLSNRIVAQQKSVVAIQDDLENIETQLDQAPGNADLLKLHREKTAELKAANEYLASLKDREAAAADRAAEPVADVRKAAPAASRFIPAPTKQKDLEAGELIATKAAIDLLAHAKGMNKETVADTYFKGDKIAQMIVKTAVEVGDTTTTGHYMELVQNDTRGLIEAMRATSVAAALAAKGIRENFNGYNQIIRPFEVGDDSGASWVGEVGHIPLSHAPVGKQTFDQYKLATIIPYSVELLDRSVVGLVDYLRRAIIAKFGKRLDDTLLSNLAALPGTRPAGILAGVTAAAATAGGGQAALIGDIKSLMGAAASANNVNRPTLLLNEVDRLAIGMMVGISGDPLYADDLAAGRLGQLEVVSSTHVPKGTAVLVQAGNFVSAFDAPQFMVSREATLVMANADGTAPTHSVDAAGAILANAAAGLGDVLVDGGIPVNGGATGAGTTGAKAINMFQVYSEALRGVMPATYGFVRPGSVAYVANATWS